MDYDFLESFPDLKFKMFSLVILYSPKLGYTQHCFKFGQRVNDLADHISNKVLILEIKL